VLLKPFDCDFHSGFRAERRGWYLMEIVPVITGCSEVIVVDVIRRGC